MAERQNPLLDDRDVAFLLLYDVHAAHRLPELPAFAEHGRETFDLILDSARRLAREVLFPAYEPLDVDPPVLENGLQIGGPGEPPRGSLAERGERLKLRDPAVVVEPAIVLPHAVCPP